MRITTVLLLLGFLPAAAQRPLQRDLREHEQTLAPYVLSPQPIVDKMLELANIKPGDLVYDLGCGDGRILITAAQRYKAHGVGIEISPKLVEMTSALVKRLGLQEQVEIRLGNILEVKFSDADVVTLYLETNSNEMLRPAMEKQLRPGTRVVSHDFEVRGWKTAKVEKIHAYNRNHTIYLYEIGAPASVKAPPKKKAAQAKAQ
ncbi:MAG: class I SAM-dependent methyltransferase [Bryobacteraceae bacterium]|nr:class I SAM-dependent methyltransferase [Bryobacteraceae bacterium]